VIGRSGAPDDRAATPMVVDDFLGDVAARGLADGLHADDGAAFRAYLAGEPDLERRDFVVHATVQDGKAHGAWIERWVSDEPDSALAHLVHGRELTAWAWHVRGARSAKNVSDEQFNQFFPRLEQAWHALERASEIDPDEGSAFAFRIDCAKGLQLDVETRIDLYEEAQARRPWQQMAHSALLQALAPKWSGGERTMFEFAERVTAEAPEGSGVHVVVAEAHVEGALEARDSYWRDPAVRAAIIAAAERSIDSPAFGPTPWAPRIRNTFGYCYWKLGDRDRARQQFDLAGPIVAGPFLVYRSPDGEAARARRDVGAGIQR